MSTVLGKLIGSQFRFKPNNYPEWYLELVDNVDLRWQMILIG
jgi:hypothetical protein